MMKTRLAGFLIACLLILACAAPVSAAAHKNVLVELKVDRSSLTSTSVSISWTSEVPVTNIEVQFDGDENKVKKIPNSSTNHYKLTGLKPATAYTIEIRCTCKDSSYIYSNTEHFTTPAAAPTPAGQGSASPAPAGSEQDADAPAALPEGVTADVRGVTLGDKAYTVTTSVYADGRTAAVIEPDPAKLKAALERLAANGANGQSLSFVYGGSEDIVSVRLPAELLNEPGAAKAAIRIVTDNAAYELPLGALTVDSLVRTLGTEADGVALTVSLSKISGTALDDLALRAKAEGITLLSAPYDFTLTASAGSGNIAELNSFGTVYAVSSIIVPGTAAEGAAAVYDAATGKFVFVPGTHAAADGRTTYTMKRTGNSVYAIVKVNRSFSDLSKHWAKADIEWLASRLIIEGRQPTAYAPNDRVTRAEFASLLVRALGLTPNVSAAAAFSDAAPDSWYAGSIGAAVQAGLISGYEDGTFKPQADITRAQLSVMTAGALKTAGKALDIAGKESEMLSVFTDSAAIRPWAQNAVGQTLLSGIVTGNPDDSFAPDNYATRAEAAVILKRLLLYIGYAQ